MNKREVVHKDYVFFVDDKMNVYHNEELCKEHISRHKRVYIRINNTIIAKAIIIAKAFPEICGKWFDGCVVHHIIAIKDGGKDNPENLKVLSEEEHKKIHKEYNLTRRKVQMLDWDGNVINEFNSMKDAVVATGINNAIITKIARNKYKTKPKYKYPKMIKNKNIDSFKYNWRYIN